MSRDDVPGCAVHASGWQPEASATLPLAFQTRGSGLDVELRRWLAGEPPSMADEGIGEEMGAVLEGRFELRCDDECHELQAGAGILIPPGAARRWRLLSDSGVLYRVISRPGVQP